MENKSFVKVNEEIYDCRKEVLGRVGEERLRASLFLAATFIEGSEQSGRSLRGGGKVGNIFALNGIDTIGIFDIREIHDAKTAPLGKIAIMPVLAELIEKRFGKCRELVVIYHHGKALCGVLSDERVNDTEGLTQYNRSSERIDNVNPAFVHLPLEIVYHRYIDGIRCLSLFL